MFCRLLKNNRQMSLNGIPLRDICLLFLEPLYVSDKFFKNNVVFIKLA